MAKQNESNATTATETTATPVAKKDSLFFRDDMVTEIKAEAARLDRSATWVVQQAWMMARANIKKLSPLDNTEKK